MENQQNDGGSELVRLRQRTRDLESLIRSLITAGDELHYVMRYYGRVSPQTIKDAQEVWAKVRSNGI